MNFSFKNQDNRVNKKLIFRFTEKEKRLYEKLKGEIPPEKIVIYIGEKFSSLDYNSMTQNNVINIIKKAKADAIILQRKLDIAFDVLSAVKKSNANTKMFLKIFFEDEPGKIMTKPNWFLINVMHSAVGINFITLDQRKSGWLNSLPLKGKYSSEQELIEPLLFALETETGKKLIEHLYDCKSVICRCGEGFKKMNELIIQIKNYSKKLNEEYLLYDTIIKEEVSTSLNFVKKMVDVYHIMSMIYSINHEETTFCFGEKR